jgi:hypothetical protein
MRHVLRVIATGATVPLVALGLVWTGGQALAAQNDSGGTSHGHGHGQALVLSGALAPSVPTDASIFGVPPGGASWQLSHGHVRLGQGGDLEINVAGLVLVTTGSNPLPDLAAAVYCNGGLSATTTPVPFSSQGNAHIHATVTLPAFCPAPAVLLEPATGGAPSDVRSIYIGFNGTA